MHCKKHSPVFFSLNKQSTILSPKRLPFCFAEIPVVSQQFTLEAGNLFNTLGEHVGFATQRIHLIFHQVYRGSLIQLPCIIASAMQLRQVQSEVETKPVRVEIFFYFEQRLGAEFGH